MPELKAAAEHIDSGEREEVLFFARTRASRAGMASLKAALPEPQLRPGDTEAGRSEEQKEAVEAVRAIRLLVRGASAALGALCAGPEVEEEEEGWLGGWLASRIFDGGLLAVPCSARGPETEADVEAAMVAIGAGSVGAADGGAAAAAATAAGAPAPTSRHNRKTLRLRLEAALDEARTRASADGSEAQALADASSGWDRLLTAAARAAGVGGTGGVARTGDEEEEEEGASIPAEALAALPPLQAALQCARAMGTDSPPELQAAARPTCRPDRGDSAACTKFIWTLFKKTKKPSGGAAAAPLLNGGRGLGIDPSTWPPPSKTGKQLRKWALKSLTRLELRATTFTGDSGKKLVELDVAFLAAFLRHSGMWKGLAAQVKAAKDAVAEGAPAPDLSKALPAPEVGGPLAAAVNVLSSTRARIMKNMTALESSATSPEEGGGVVLEEEDEEDRTTDAPPAEGGSAAEAEPASGAGGPSSGAGEDGTPRQTTTGQQVRIRPRRQMRVLHAATGQDLVDAARGALMLWAFCAAGAGPLQHEGLARASRASAAAHAQEPPTNDRVKREFQLQASFGVMFQEAADEAAGVKPTGPSESIREVAKKRAEAFVRVHPDARKDGLKPVLTALEILMGETHTLDLGALAGALHRRRQRAADRAIGLRGLELLLAGVSGQGAYPAAQPDCMPTSALLLSADALWCMPDALRVRSAYERRRGLKQGPGHALRPG